MARPAAWWILAAAILVPIAATVALALARDAVYDPDEAPGSAADGRAE